MLLQQETRVPENKLWSLEEYHVKQNSSQPELDDCLSLTLTSYLYPDFECKSYQTEIQILTVQLKSQSYYTGCPKKMSPIIFVVLHRYL